MEGGKMNIYTKKHLPTKVKHEAINISRGLYSLNAQSSEGYSCSGNAKTGITVGEFIYAKEIANNTIEHDYLFMKSDKFHIDLINNGYIKQL
jgi:hypothetical protein